MGARKDRQDPPRRSVLERIVPFQATIDLQAKLNKRRRARDEEANSRTITEVLEPPRTRQIARTNPCPDLEKSSGRQSVPIIVPAGSSALLAQDPNAYINQKLEEFRRQFVGHTPGSGVENQSIFNPAI